MGGKALAARDGCISRFGKLGVRLDNSWPQFENKQRIDE